MNNIQTVTRQDQRPFCELVRHCEIRAIASRIAVAVVHFFTVVARFICECICGCHGRGSYHHRRQDNHQGINFEAYQGLITIPIEEREGVSVLAQSLYPSPEISETEKTWIIGALGAIPTQEREEVLNYARPLFQRRTHDRRTPYFMRGVIQTIGLIPSQERDALIEETDTILNRFFIIEETDTILNRFFIKDTTRLFEKIRALPLHEKAQVIALVLRVTHGALSHDSITDAVLAIDANERMDVVDHALQLINPQMSPHDKIMMIQAVAAVPAGQRADYVRDRLAGVHNPAVHNHPAQGVNVHEGDRDPRTRDAIILLRQHQGDIALEGLEQAKNEFIKYLTGFPMNPVDKQLADDALRKPRGNEGFGPLIGGGGFTVLGLPVTGEEMLGRLWIYASQLPEPEQTNTKRGMIFALKRSYYEDGTRICNQGKTQQLILAVLQGRLKGVDVDGVAIPKPLTRNQTLSVFIEAHREIQVRTQLLTAVPVFRPDDPFIDRRELVEDIHEYADQAEIPSVKEEFLEANPNTTVLADLTAAANRFCDLHPLVDRAAFLADIEAHANEVANTT